MVGVHGSSVVLNFVVVLQLTLLLTLKNFGFRYQCFDIFKSLHEDGFVPGEFLVVNIIDFVTLDVHAFIRVPANSHQILVASALVSESIAY